MLSHGLYQKVQAIVIQCLADENLPAPLPSEQLDAVKLLGSQAICDSLSLAEV